MRNDSAPTHRVYADHPSRTVRPASDSRPELEVSKGIEVVYYIDLGDGTIKIGTSTNFLSRIHKYHLGNARGERVLAIEFGGRDLERQRHEQFAHLRIGKRERFEGESVLWEHIEALREQHHITV